jgi:hypothetical protein
MFKQAFSYNCFYFYLFLVNKGVVGFNLTFPNNIHIACAKKSFFFIRGSGKKFIKIIYPSNKEVILNRYKKIYFEINQHTFSKKKKIYVRGIAKNPVDHPNGGNTNTKQPLRTP